MIGWNKPLLTLSSLSGLNQEVGVLWAPCARYAENCWGCWHSGIERMPGSSSTSPAASVWVLPATKAEIDLDGRQLISEKRVASLFQGRQMESGLKVSAAPLSAVNLALWTDFFVVFFSYSFEICAQSGVIVDIFPPTKAIRLAQIQLLILSIAFTFLVVLLWHVHKWPVTQTQVVTGSLLFLVPTIYITHL